VVDARGGGTVVDAVHDDDADDDEDSAGGFGQLCEDIYGQSYKTFFSLSLRKRQIE
jgi:hypothetical protein